MRLKVDDKRGWLFVIYNYEGDVSAETLMLRLSI